uniref:F-box domain-containing protein n=1 Tax=Aegilops tauschii TaxID=37682 RepID=R7VYX7_AEGTA
MQSMPPGRAYGMEANEVGGVMQAAGDVEEQVRREIGPRPGQLLWVFKQSINTPNLQIVTKTLVLRDVAPSSESTKAAATTRPWAYLSPELLADVCARLHDATDFVRFHAVCQPWRDAHPSQLSPVETQPRQTFQPWLLSQRIGRIINSHVIYYGRLVSSEPTRSSRRGSNNGIVLVEPAESSAGDERNWVASADGRFAWLFAGGSEPTLFNIVTGEVKPLPPFPDQDDINGIGRRLMNPRGIVYGDGTIFLYSFDTELTRRYYRYHPGFTAAILRPGDTAWTAVENWLNMRPTHHACAAYHDGKVLVWVSVFFWCILTPNFGLGANGGNNADVNLETTWDKLEEEYYERDQSYILESRGELPWASVLVEHEGRHDYAEANMASKLAVRAGAEARYGHGCHWHRVK